MSYINNDNSSVLLSLDSGSNWQRSIPFQNLEIVDIDKVSGSVAISPLSLLLMYRCKGISNIPFFLSINGVTAPDCLQTR